jgi:hypothetical protein
LTRGAANLATLLYGLGLLWLAPASPYRAALFAFVGLLLLLHWTLWRSRIQGTRLARLRVASPRARSRELASRYSQGVLGISTGLYVAGLARTFLL